ncbi:hypothetical protein KCP77_14480 [Salmonella enterica subsp. enterica]|nr:hypothetical protein KCP77_14480 [Salmonella enterica subsp. enterica]
MGAMRGGNAVLKPGRPGPPGKGNVVAASSIRHPVESAAHWRSAMDPPHDVASPKPAGDQQNGRSAATRR